MSYLLFQAFEPVRAALFSSQGSGSDLQEEKKHAKHFIFTVDALSRQGEEIRGKHQISAPTGAPIASSICGAQLSQ